jgi:heterokaryon incompatibility protein (HET)
MDTTEYCGYKALSQDASEVRLLKIDQNNDGMIRCRLKVFSIDECPLYIALSYTWGEMTPAYPILLDQTEVRIRHNLYHALRSILGLKTGRRPQSWPNGPTRWESNHERTIRRPPEMGLEGESHVRKAATIDFFWIDCICINQGDVLERNHRVGMMGKIFSLADLVISYLGPESDESIEVMSIMSRIEYRQPIDLTLTNLGRLEALNRANYWTRIWIVQEVLLAKNIVLGWGYQFVSWAALEYLLYCLRKPWTAPTSHGIQNDFTFVIKDTILRTTVNMGSARIGEESDTIPEWAKLVGQRLWRLESRIPSSLFVQQKSPSLESLITHFGRYRCTEVMDKVIGLLGLVNAEIAHLADYSMPLEHFFREVCKYVFNEKQYSSQESRMRFQCFLGANLGLSSTVFRQPID